MVINIEKKLSYFYTYYCVNLMYVICIFNSLTAFLTGSWTVIGN